MTTGPLNPVSVAKEAIQYVSQEIIVFKENTNNLRLKIKDVITGKDSQIKVLEGSTKAIIADVLRNTLKDLWRKYDVHEEFQQSSIDDLVKLTAQTSSGALTKSAFDAVKAKAQQDLHTQNFIKGRLLRLENECLKADIKPPLPRQMVEAFLYDLDYDDKLDAIIQAEVKRMEPPPPPPVVETIEPAKPEPEPTLDSLPLQEQHEKLKGYLKHSYDIYNRYPTRDNESHILGLTKKLEEVAAKIAAQKESVGEPDAVVNKDKVPYEVNVYYTLEKCETYRFTSSANPDKSKMERYFREVTANKLKIKPDDITNVTIQEHDIKSS